MTAFADIVSALVSALSGLAGGNVYRGDAWKMPETADSMIIVRVDRSTSTPSGIAGGPVDWQTQVAVEIRVRFSPDAGAADVAVDSLLGNVYATLAAFSAPGVQSVTPAAAIDWLYHEAESNVAGATISCVIVHRTLSATLTTWT